MLAFQPRDLVVETVLQNIVTLLEQGRSLWLNFGQFSLVTTHPQFSVSFLMRTLKDCYKNMCVRASTCVFMRARMCAHVVHTLCCFGILVE